MDNKLKQKLIVGLLIILATTINIFLGSPLRYVSWSCLIIDLEEMLIFLSIFLLPISFVFKKNFRKKFVPWLFVFLLSGLFMKIADDFFIDKFQYQITSNNLDLVCSAISEFKENEGEIPDRLEDLYPEYLDKKLTSGHTLFNNEFKYKRIDSLSFEIEYKVRYDYPCATYNCNPMHGEMYTCISCAGISDDYFQKLLDKHLQKNK